MHIESIITIVIALAGLAMSWGVWVSVSLFKHEQQIALIKQERALLVDLKEIMQDIRIQLRGPGNEFNS